MGVDFEQWSKKIGCFCNCFRRAKLHGYKYTSRWSNSTIVPGIHLTFSWQLIITLLLLASGEEPNPGSSRPSVSSSDAGLCTTNCHVCKLRISDLEFIVFSLFKAYSRVMPCFFTQTAELSSTYE